MLDRSTLVSSEDCGISGLNYYWKNRERLGITEEELAATGVVDGRTLIHRDLVEPLLEVQRRLRRNGYTIHIEDGYRSEATYKLAYRKLLEREGQAFVDSRFNLVDMPHASGRVVDLALISLETGQPVWLRDDRNGLGAAFVGFYRGRRDVASLQYERRQRLLIGNMLHEGFVLGSKREVWHFELP